MKWLGNCTRRSFHELFLSGIRHCNFYILTYDKATAISIGEFVLGSSKHQFFTKLHVRFLHPNHPDQCFLARIEYFANVDVRDNLCSNDSSFSINKVFISSNPVNYGSESQCKFGPNQLHLY